MNARNMSLRGAPPNAWIGYGTDDIRSALEIAGNGSVEMTMGRQHLEAIVAEYDALQAENARLARSHSDLEASAGQTRVSLQSEIERLRDIAVEAFGLLREHREAHGTAAEHQMSDPEMDSIAQSWRERRDNLIERVTVA